MSYLHVQNLSIRYGDHSVLQDFSLEIPDHGLVAIIGPSGCGKTTLLKSLNRLLDLHEGAHVSGRVLLDGEDIYRRGADLLTLRQKIGFIPQRPYPLPMSIFENVAFGLRLLGRESSRDLKAKVHQGLKQAGLLEEVASRLDQPASQLSIGQQQRLALARTLVLDPEVVLLDEPTSALDPVSVRIVEQQLMVLKRERALVLVTHHLRQAQRLADHIVFLCQGSLVEQGPAEAFFASPATDMAHAYLQGELC